MTKISLHKVKRKTGAVWMLRWYDSRGKRCGETIGKVGVMTKRQAEHARRQRQGKIDNGLAKLDRPERMTLGAFSEHYKDRRRQGDQGRGHLRGAPKLTEATITDHAMTLRYMVHHFGEDQAIDSITLADATEFIDALEAGRLAEARKTSKQEYGMSAQTVKGHIRNAKAAFNWAHRFSLIRDNPFADFDGRPLATEPNQFVSLKTFEQAVKAAPTPGWRAMFGLCRLAGLRLEAARTLPWSGHATDSDGKRHRVGIDWDRRRVCVVGNHKTRRSYREVPICMRLYSILHEAYQVAEDDADTITGLTPNNLTRIAQGIVRAAGLTPWPKMYQAMRSSCENEWKQRGVAEATYCAWLGHSPKVSREHYVAPTNDEYQAIIRAA